MTWIAKGVTTPGVCLVRPEPDASVGLDRHQPRVLAAGPLADVPLGDVGGALEPQRERRHRELGVGTDERHERLDVVRLERLDVPAEQRLLLGIDPGGVDGLGIDLGHGGSGPLERAVDRGDRGVQQFGDLDRLPTQHLPQDQHGALAGRQVLERGDEGQADRLAGLGELGGVRDRRKHPGIGDGLNPGVLGQHGAERRSRAGRSFELHRPGPPLSAPEHVEAHVGGDPVQPRPDRGPSLERVVGPPGPNHRLLHRVLGVEAGAEHAVAVAGELTSMELELGIEVQDICRGAPRRCADAAGFGTADA